MFPTKSISLYWRCQIIGWCTVSLYWLYIALARDHFSVSHAALNYCLDVAICIGLTHGYRNFTLNRNWNRLSIKRLIPRVIPAVVTLSFLFMTVMNTKASIYVYFVYRENIFRENLFVWNPVFITGLRHMSIWILAYQLYHFYMREMKIATENAELSLVAKQAQLSNLRAQLNPHFLFNSLSSIKSLIVENPKIARRAIDLLSDLLRTSLYEKDQKSISIKDELSLVGDYVELEKLRFEDRLAVKMDVDASVENAKIPPLIIQLLVENAIKHGIDQSIAGGQIQIKVHRKDNYVQIKIQNSGKLAKDHMQGLGLDNLEQRLQLQYKGEARFHIEESSENLVTATLLIPNHHYDSL